MANDKVGNGLGRRDLLGLLTGSCLTAALPGAAYAQAPSHWPRNLTLGTASTGGTYFVYGSVWATLVGEKLGLTISTQQTQGPLQNIILVSQGRLELGMTTMGVAREALTGEGDWTRGQRYTDIRALFPMYDTPFQGVALRGSGIASMAGLQGKRVGLGPRASTTGAHFPRMLETMGYSASLRYGQAADMAGQLADGLIDAFVFGSGKPVPAFSELEATNDVVFFGFTADEIAKITAAMPETTETVVPAGTYRTLTADQPAIGIYNFAFCHKDLPEDLAHAIVATVHANQPELMRGHVAAAETLPENIRHNTVLPFHPGAARYYREQGLEIPAAALPPA